jgi:2-methylcitrate dehydratase PrpD
MRYEDLPSEAIRWAKISLVDTLGCAFAGIEEDTARIARKVLAGTRDSGPSLIWGTAQHALPLEAATINGTAAHALDSAPW